MINELIYVYCISDSPPELSRNNAFEGIKSIPLNGFYMIVKSVSEEEFSEENFKKNLSDIQWLETNAREHVEIINLLMKENTMIPFKFGTIFQAETGLKKFVADYSDSLSENFQYIRGKEEWSVKIYCNRSALCEKIDELSEEAASLEKQIMASMPGKAFLLKRKKTDLIENEMDRICKNFGQEYFDELRTLSESSHLNNLLPKEFTGREDSMILNATFLVSKNKVNDFNSVVIIQMERGEKSGFCIEVSGPWPPFSFISIKEKK
jgi:hypothetical protein